MLMIVDGPQWPPRHDGDEWSWEAMSKQARREWEEIRERSMRAQGDCASGASWSDARRSATSSPGRSTTTRSSRPARGAA